LGTTATVVEAPSVVSPCAGFPDTDSCGPRIGGLARIAHRRRLEPFRRVRQHVLGSVLWLASKQPIRLAAGRLLLRTMRVTDFCQFTKLIRAPVPRWFSLPSSTFADASSRRSSDSRSVRLTSAGRCWRPSLWHPCRLFPRVDPLARINRARNQPRSFAVCPRDRLHTVETTQDTFYRSGTLAPRCSFEHPARALAGAATWPPRLHPSIQPRYHVTTKAPTKRGPRARSPLPVGSASWDLANDLSTSATDERRTGTPDELLILAREWGEDPRYSPTP